MAADAKAEGVYFEPSDPLFKFIDQWVRHSGIRDRLSTAVEQKGLTNQELTIAFLWTLIDSTAASKIHDFVLARERFWNLPSSSSLAVLGWTDIPVWCPLFSRFIAQLPASRFIIAYVERELFRIQSYDITPKLETCVFAILLKCNPVIIRRAVSIIAREDPEKVLNIAVQHDTFSSSLLETRTCVRDWTFVPLLAAIDDNPRLTKHVHKIVAILKKFRLFELSSNQIAVSLQHSHRASETEILLVAVNHYLTSQSRCRRPR